MTEAPLPAAPRHVAVIGAGIVGACVALDLVRRGVGVTIIEPGEPGGAGAASYGNGAFISPASVVPISMPGLWRKVPGYLIDSAGPLTIRWRHLPRLAPWLVAFVAAGASEARARALSRKLAALLAGAPGLHAGIADFCGCPELIRADGILYAYRDRAEFAADALAWRLRVEAGVVWREMDGPALGAFAPALSRGYGFGALVPGGAHCLDPGGYTARIVARAVAGGARLARARAVGFRGDGRVEAVLTDAGEVGCDAAVIAAGIASAALAKAAGDRLPLEAERGYHVEVGAPGVALPCPVMTSDGKMANTLTLGGLRAAGQVELASAGAPPDWRRAEILLGHLVRSYPGMTLDPGRVRRWQGNRPSMPDGLPVIGRARLGGVWHAFGHGHVGLNAAPGSAALLGALMTGAAPPIDPEPYAPGRFGGWFGGWFGGRFGSW